jgi:hypothetical protein
MSFFVDFSKGFDEMVYQLFHSNDNIPESNSLMLFDYYKYLHFLRHNFLHYFVLKMLGQDWTEEKPLSMFFDYLPVEYGRKTPDICIKLKEIWLIMDVSISNDIALTEKNKKEKYVPICLFIEKKEKCVYVHINVKGDFSNIHLELEKIKDYKLFELNHYQFSRLIDIIEDKKKWVNEKIDKEIFESLKNKEFKKKIVYTDDNKDEKEILFREDLRLENIGSYQDINIDLDGFKKFNKSFNKIDEIEKSVKDYVEEDLVGFFKKILEDDNDDLNKKYKDEKLNSNQFEEARQGVLEMNNRYKKRIPKPTHHLMIPLPDDINPDYIVGEDKQNEQLQLLEFMKDFLTDLEKHPLLNKHNKFLFCKDLFSEFLWCLKESSEKEINNDIYFKIGSYQKYREEYERIKKELNALSYYNQWKKLKTEHYVSLNLKLNKEDVNGLKLFISEIEEKNKKIQNKTTYSFRDYLSENVQKLSDKCSFIHKDKLMKMNFEKFSVEGKQHYEKSGIGKDFEKIEKEERKSVELDSAVEVEKMLVYLAQKSKHKYKYDEEDFLLNTNNIGDDDPKTKQLKKESIKNYGFYYNMLKDTNAYNYFKNCHFFYRQLMHLSQINTPKGNFHFFNCGLKNMCVIMACTFNNSVHDYGKPFMTIIKTKNPDLYSSFYGKVKRTEIGNGFYYVYSNWRRLPLNKVTFMCDVFYSTLSSTMNTIMSSAMPASYLLNNKIEQIYSLRGIIGYATNQKIGELLMDTRYAYMSSFSIYTNISKLLQEKFGPPYNTCLETWIVEKLFRKLPLIHDKALKDGIKQTVVEMDNNVRNINTIGGLINLPSLWLENNIYDITELTDEAFIYVHTMKEPANIFHENVKALKTITQFQNEYDKLPNKFHYGTFNTLKEIEYFLKYPTKIGCSIGVIVKSTEYTISKEKPFFKKIIHHINDESIGELLSTKAVIADLDRELVLEKNPSTREIKKKKKRMKIQIPETIDKLSDQKFDFYLLTAHSKYYSKLRTRQKVMETVLDKIEENNFLNTTVSFANDFICQDKGKVIADICIKAQYGAKREFYVVNIGAKALARVTENFFKELCVNSPNEAISVPGDEKILKMQSMLDRIYYNPITKKHKLIYVNGDCTKWSAAETMSSFLAMCYSLKNKITENMYELLCSTFNAWSDKHIQIPMDIFNKVVPNKLNHTDFLKDSEISGTGMLKSTQNFLQGMFNYSSSYKAVCCINYTYHIWKKIYPETRLLIEHLEHSDDYVLVVLYEDQKEFEKFRILQKMMMRLHGYNDSDRKTSCQPYLMEFVSQISFNGVMLYPQIKKSKEVNLSLPCTGYTTDIEAALSRIGECSRVGCNQSFLYFFQRLHIYCVAHAYSLLPGMINNYNRSIPEMLNQPIELFGLPDMLPIFSMYCRGNGNNYRLYKYSGSYQKYLINFLFNEITDENEDFLSENIEYKYNLKTPSFMYELFNKTMKKMKKRINIDANQIKSFWEDHFSYKLLKPKETTHLITWIKCMFYNKTFLEAYTKTSRSMMTMRLSRFIKTKIVKKILKIEDHFSELPMLTMEAMTMKDYYFDMLSKFELYRKKMENNNNIQPDSVMILKVLTKCDPTYSAIYSVVDKLNILSAKGQKNRTIQIAQRTPTKLKTINIQNEPSLLLQYLFNKEDFIKDKRVLISKESLDKDLLEINERIPKELFQSKNMMSLLAIYNDLMINREKKIVMFGYNRHTNTLVDSILEVYSYNFLPGHILTIAFNNVINIQDPFTGRTIFSKGSRLTPDYFRQSCDNICLLFVFRCFYYNENIGNFLKFMENIEFKIFKEDDYENYNYKEILKKMTIEYMKNFNYSLEDQKIICFLKACLINNYDAIDQLVSSIYSFSYRYIHRDTPINNVYYGETLVQYTYFNTTCKAFYNQKYYNNPLLILQKYYQSIAPILYNIAIKMTTGMTDSEFERTINKDRMPIITTKEIENFNDFITKNNIVAVVKYSPDYCSIVKIKNILDTDAIYPVFLTSDIIKKSGDISYKKNNNVRPQINLDKICINLGKSKLYTLPFWKCKQYDNMEYIGKDTYFEGMMIRDLLKNSLIENFLLNKLTRHNLELGLKKLSNDNIVGFLKTEIMKHKIYDIDYSTIINLDNAPNLKEIILFNQSYPKTYEKKYLLDEKIFFSLESKENNPRSNDAISNDNPFQNTEINENDTIDDILKKNVDKMIFTDDFLIDDDDYDIPNIDGQLFDDEDQPKTTQYYNEELLNLKYGDVSVADIFVVKPKKKQFYEKNQKEGVGYYLTKLKQSPSLQLLTLCHKHQFEKTTQTINIMSMLTNIEGLKDIYRKAHEKEGIFLEMYYITLYKLFCNTFLKTDEKENLDFFVKDNKLILCRKLRGKVSEENIDFLQKKQLLLTKKENELKVKINYDQAKKIFFEDISKGLTIKQNINVCLKIDDYINQLELELSKENEKNFLEELLTPF